MYEAQEICGRSDPFAKKAMWRGTKSKNWPYGYELVSAANITTNRSNPASQTHKYLVRKEEKLVLLVK